MLFTALGLSGVVELSVSGFVFSGAKAGDIESADHWLERMLQDTSCRIEGAYSSIIKYHTAYYTQIVLYYNTPSPHTRLPAATVTLTDVRPA